VGYDRFPGQIEACCRAERSSASRRASGLRRSRSPNLSRHGSLCQFVLERTGLVLTVALALDFFVCRCILAVITAAVLMLRDRATALRVATLLFVCHSRYPFRYKEVLAGGSDLKRP